LRGELGERAQDQRALGRPRRARGFLHARRAAFSDLGRLRRGRHPSHGNGLLSVVELRRRGAALSDARLSRLARQGRLRSERGSFLPLGALGGRHRGLVGVGRGRLADQAQAPMRTAAWLSLLAATALSGCLAYPKFYWTTKKGTAQLDDGKPIVIK